MFRKYGVNKKGSFEVININYCYNDGLVYKTITIICTSEKQYLKELEKLRKDKRAYYTSLNLETL